MKILIVNPAHPDTPHISAVRAWRFAQELSKFGHQTTLLTGGSPTPGGAGRSKVNGREDSLLSILEVPSTQNKAAAARIPTVIRKAHTAWRLWRHGGANGAWVDAAVAIAESISEDSRPDIVWCTFGAMEAVFAARRIARRLRCPWVIDIKDNWELYVPRGMRKIMTARTTGWSGVTSNARFTAEMARKWQRADAVVVYSGVDNAFLRGRSILAREDARPAFQINIVGSLYYRVHLCMLLEGIRMWSDSLTAVQRAWVRVSYLGNDCDLFLKEAARMISTLAHEAPGFLKIEELAAYCCHAAVNTYVAHSGGFHHKVLELLASGPPIIACPSEKAEAHELADQTGGHLHDAVSPESVALRLERIYDSWPTRHLAKPNAGQVQPYSWAGQARVLEAFLVQTVIAARASIS